VYLQNSIDYGLHVHTIMASNCISKLDPVPEIVQSVQRSVVAKGEQLASR
jgi:hypothetical protein